MFAVVLFNLLKCMIPCGIVLVAFAMSFHVLNSNKIFQSSLSMFDKFANITDPFKAASSTVTQDDQFNTFANIYLAILKTAVMMTGEFNSGDMHLTKTWFALMFTMFVFVVAIGFYNLLNGLAVSDVAILREKSTMLGIKQKLMMLYEWNIIFKDDRNDTTFQRITIELTPKDIIIKAISSRKPAVPHDDEELSNVSKEETEYKYSGRYIIHEKLVLALKEILHASKKKHKID